MPLSKKDNPASMKDEKATTGPDEPETEEAVKDLLDEGAGAPAGLEEAAEDLPEKDENQQAHKDAMTAESVSEEVSAKVQEVDTSPDAAETPSGGALKAVEGIDDPIEQAEAYKREKAARRHGTA